MNINIMPNSRLKISLLISLSKLQSLVQGLQSLTLEVNTDKNTVWGLSCETREKQTE